MLSDNKMTSADELIRLIELDHFLRETREDFYSPDTDDYDLQESDKPKFITDDFFLSILDKGGARKDSGAGFKEKVAESLEELLPSIIDILIEDCDNDLAAVDVYFEWLDFLRMDKHPDAERRRIILEHGKPLMERVSSAEAKFLVLRLGFDNLFYMGEIPEEERPAIVKFFMEDGLKVLAGITAKGENGLNLDAPTTTIQEDGVYTTYPSYVMQAVAAYEAVLYLLDEYGSEDDVYKFTQDCYKEMWSLILDAEDGFDKEDHDTGERTGRYVPDTGSMINFVSHTLEFLRPPQPTKRFSKATLSLVSQSIASLYERGNQYGTPVVDDALDLLGIATTLLGIDDQVSKTLVQDIGSDCVIRMMANKEFETAANLLDNIRYTLQADAVAFSLFGTDEFGENKRLAVHTNYTTADQTGRITGAYSVVTFANSYEVFVCRDEDDCFERCPVNNATDIVRISNMHQLGRKMLEQDLTSVVPYGSAFRGHSYPRELKRRLASKPV